MVFLRIIVGLICVSLCLGLSAQTPADIEKQVSSLRKEAKFQEAIDLITDFLETSSLPPVESTRLLNYRGHIKGDLKEYDSQLQDFLTVLEIKEENGDRAGMAGSYMNIGNSYRFQGLHEKSLEYYTLSRDIATETRDTNRIANALINMSAAIRLVDSTVNRVPILLEAQELYKRIDKTNNNIHTALGVAYSDLEEHEKAIESFRESLQIEGITVKTKALLMNNIGHDLELLGRLDSAEVYFAESYRIASEYEMLDEQLMATRNLGEVFAKLGEYDSAYVYMNEHRLLQLEEAKILLDDEVLSLQEQFQAAEREREIERKTAQRNLFAVVLVGLAVLGVVVVVFLRRNHKTKEALSRQQIDLKEAEISNLFTDLTLKVAQSEAEGELKERQRVGRDLHDRIGPLLSSIKLKFSASRDAEKETHGLDESLNLLDESIGEIRRISHNLSSASLSQYGFLHHVQQLSKHLEDNGAIKVNFTHHNIESGLPNTIERHLSDIISELAQNVVKHAEANLLTIDINRDEEELSVIIEDDGRGFDSSQNAQGIGLKNLKLRVAEMDGELTIDSKIGRGTAVVIDIPLTPVTEKS